MFLSSWPRKGRYYPNNSTAYLYARTHIHADSVLIFSFIPVPLPRTVEEYEGAKARYWSICLGATSNTRSYYSIYDKRGECERRRKGDLHYLPETKFKTRRDTSESRGPKAIGRSLEPFFVWDSEKQDVDGKPIGDVIAIMYRNILPDKDWEYSISRMTPTEYKDDEGEPIDKSNRPGQAVGP